MVILVAHSSGKFVACIHPALSLNIPYVFAACRNLSAFEFRMSVVTCPHDGHARSFVLLSWW